MPTVQQAAASTPTPVGLPDIKVSVRQTFGIDSDLEVPAFSQPSEHVPDFDDAYRFDRNTTLAILAGFAFNRRVMWLVSARRFYDCIEQLAKQRITVYATADDVASFPPPHTVLEQAAGNGIRRSGT